MELEKIKLKRDVRFKSFLIGYALIIFGVLIYIVFKHLMLALCNYVFDSDVRVNTAIIFLLFGTMKILVITFFLIPAIALHWQYKSLLKQSQK